MLYNKSHFNNIASTIYDKIKFNHNKECTRNVKLLNKKICKSTLEKENRVTNNIQRI